MYEKYVASGTRWSFDNNQFFLRTFKGEIDSISFKQDIELKQQKSYRSTCAGDSGAGQWVTLDEDGSSTSNKFDGRSALVAIVKGSIEIKFEVNGKLIKAVCGSNMVMDNGDLLTKGTTAVRATHPVI